MFLISKLMFDAVYRQKYVTIENYHSDNHYETFYYFRLGAKDKDGRPDASEYASVTVPKNGLVRVWSLETFRFSERVWGLFGGPSDIAKKGLQLLHGPSIDPTFSGSLELALANATSQDVEIKVGENIGKLHLFDVSDSLIEGHRFLDETKRRERQDAAVEIERKVKEGIAALWNR